MYTTLWKQDLKYDDAAEPCYNGNIAEMTLTPMWQQGVTRKYSYDRLDRLASMTSTDGSVEILQIVNEEDQNLFRQIFHKDDREYIVFDDNGFLVQSALEPHKSESWLYNSLTDMNTDSQITSVELSSSYDYADNEGNVLHREMGNIEVEDDYYKDTEFKSPSGLTTAETGLCGKTLFPAPGIDKDSHSSLDNNVHIYINKELSKIGAMETIGHELFGHGYLYYLTKDRTQSSHINKGMVELNRRLANYIAKARKEIINNQR